MLNNRKMKVTVHNVTDGEEKFVVARYSEEDNSLWYWGRYPDKEKAIKAAEEIGGLVLEDE